MEATLTYQGGVKRWFYVGLAVTYAIVAVVGFLPRSMEIFAGELRNPPLIVHLHAVLMGLWLVLFIVQASLVATENRSLHQKIGLTSIALAPAMWVAMVAVTVSWHRFMAELGPDLAAFGTNMLLSLFRSIVLFPVFLTWGLLSRKAVPETHKRMMVLATLVLASGGIDRMDWLPGHTLPNSYDGTHAYQLLLLMPALIYDVVQRGRPHRAYLVGLALLLAWMVATHFLWGSGWWLANAPILVWAG